MPNMLSLFNSTPFILTRSGFCLSLPSMNLSVFWYAVSGHYVYIDGSVMLCFAGRGQTEPRSFVFMSIQTKAGLSAISFRHSVTMLALLNQWMLNGLNICWRLLVCLHKALRWLFSDAGTECDSVHCISSHFSTNQYVFTSLMHFKILLSYIAADCSHLFLPVLFLGNETDSNVSQH